MWVQRKDQGADTLIKRRGIHLSDCEYFFLYLLKGLIVYIARFRKVTCYT